MSFNFITTPVVVHDRAPARAIKCARATWDDWTKEYKICGRERSGRMDQRCRETLSIPCEHADAEAHHRSSPFREGKPLTRYLLLLAMLIASPAAAQSVSGIWKEAGDRIDAAAAGISFPREIAGLHLTKTSEFTHQGEGLDSAAEYQSADKALWATIYVYLPAYGDPALAEYRTDKTIHQVYGAKVTRVAEGLAPLGGRSNAAIRTIYVGGELKNSGVLASGAAFAKVGRWIVKLRVSGPLARRGDVEASLDAFLAAARLQEKTMSATVAPAQIAAPCPPAPSGTAALFKNGKAVASALGEAMVAASDNLGVDPKSKIAPPFPANGLTPMCLRGEITIGDQKLEVLQPAGEPQPHIILVPLDDEGGVITVRKDLITKAYTIGKAEIARFTVYGQIDRLPDNAELTRVLGGALPGLFTVRAALALKQNGDSNVEISSDLMKK
ncbi:hypothetical protein U1839_08465 [Sphingomonas sp. RT2P30]|uniref:hypothetical protein n=1 Tax=Parasphingomonas halimpatiens TaxID=3096162 RepID=UPI002FC62A35